jgi:hypothetical protein
VTLLGSRVSMTHVCSTLRNQGVVDEWGGSSTNFVEYLADVACRAWTSAAREPVDVDRTVTVEDLRMAVPTGTDITENDLVGDITERGATIFPGPMTVEAVLHYSTHLEVVLARIR